MITASSHGPSDEISDFPQRTGDWNLRQRRDDRQGGDRSGVPVRPLLDRRHVGLAERQQERRMDEACAQVGGPSSGGPAAAFRCRRSSSSLPSRTFLSGRHDGLYPMRLHRHREPHQGELPHRGRPLALHVRSWSDLLHLATHHPRSGLQRLQERSPGSGEFPDRSEPAFASLSRVRDWSGSSWRAGCLGVTGGG